MPATSHRVSFERWLRNFTGYEVEDIRVQRSEFGYEHRDWDLAFAAYKAAIGIERSRQQFRLTKPRFPRKPALRR